MSTFLPNDTQNTTDNQPYPLGWMTVMSTISYGFLIATVTMIWRTITHWSFNETKHSKTTFSSAYAATAALQLVTMTCWPIVLYGLTWGMYGNSNNQYSMSNNAKDLQVLTTSSMRLALIIIYMGCAMYVYRNSIKDSFNKGYIKFKNTFLGRNNPKVSAEKSDDVTMRGFNVITPPSIRYTIFYSTIILFGTIPLVGGILSYKWNMAPGNVCVNVHSTNHCTFYVALNMASSSLLVIYTFFWGFFVMGAYSKLVLYEDFDITTEEKQSLVTDDETKEKADKTLNFVNRMYEKHPGFVRVGFSIAPFGFFRDYRGIIPIVYFTHTYIVARVLYAFSEGMMLYVDPGPALVYFGKYLIPLVLSIYAQNSMYYAAYETFFVFFFDMVCYFTQALYPFSPNYNYVTLRQSKFFANDKMWSVMETSIATVTGIAFAAVCFALIRMLFHYSSKSTFTMSF